MLKENDWLQTYDWLAELRDDGRAEPTSDSHAHGERQLSLGQTFSLRSLPLLGPVPARRPLPLLRPVPAPRLPGGL